MDFYHVNGEGILDIFAFDHLAALKLLISRRFDCNHGCLSYKIESDFDGDFFVFHARLQDHDFEDALFDFLLDAVLISVSEDTLQGFITSFDLVIGPTFNPEQKLLLRGISWQRCIERGSFELELKVYGLGVDFGQSFVDDERDSLANSEGDCAWVKTRIVESM